MDIRAKQIIKLLTNDSRKRKAVVSLLESLEKDGFIYTSKDGLFKWNENVKLIFISYWVSCLENNLGLIGNNCKWKEFEELFCLKYGSLKNARKRLFEFMINGNLNYCRYYMDILSRYAIIHVSISERSDNYSFEKFCEELFYIPELKPDNYNTYQIKDLRTTDPLRFLLLKLEVSGWIFYNKRGCYNWKDGTTKTLIAYWVNETWNYLRTNGKVPGKMYMDDKGIYKTTWKPFENLFSLKLGSLKTAKANWLNLKQNRGKEFKPRNYKLLEPYTKI